MQNFPTWNEKTYAGKLHDWMELYSQDKGICNYAISSVLFLTTVREKYLKMYESFIEELRLYSKAIRVLSKRISTHFSITTIKTGENSRGTETSNCKIQQRLQSSSDKTLHETGYVWNRQPKELYNSLYLSNPTPRKD